MLYKLLIDFKMVYWIAISNPKLPYAIVLFNLELYYTILIVSFCLQIVLCR